MHYSTGVDLIHTENLTKYFDDFKAVDGVDLDVPAGQVLALLGPNGAGKTTTVRMLNSILVPSSGKAIVAGFDVVYESSKVRANVGVLTELHGLYGRMRAVEYLEFYAHLYRLPEPFFKRRIEELLVTFGLIQFTGKRLGEYSKGMRQKLALVRALLHDPRVLLLDEPTSAMDPESARVVRDAISELRSNDRAIILCTHNLVEAEELADRVAIIRRGKILMNDTINGLKQQLLGLPEYEARFIGNVNEFITALPTRIVLTAQGDDFLRFQVSSPTEDNPLLIRQLASNCNLISFHEVVRSLEQAYLKVMENSGDEGGE